MALTLTAANLKGQACCKPVYISKVHVVCDASYATDGYAFNPATVFGVPGITVLAAFIDPGSKAGAFSEHEAVFVAASNKLKIMYNNGGTLAEVAAQGNLGTFAFDLVVIGY